MKEGILQLVKDVLFPIFCLGCGQEGNWICKDCTQKIKVQFKTEIKAVPGLDRVTAFFNYQDGEIIPKLIKQLKYSYARDLAYEVAKMLQNKMTSQDIFESGFEVIPVPLHKIRQRQRGFNQAELIARQLTFLFPHQSLIINKLKRIKNTPQQTKLSGENRKNNLDDAFVWSASGLAPKKVVLVDDVFTTGATMQACAKTLKRSGTETVWGLVLARRFFMPNIS
ncbi:MAG: ComF family protein [bacterium]